MHITATPWIAAGFAAMAVSAGATIAAPATSLPSPQSHDVQLVSGDVTWGEVLHSALTNATGIYDHFAPDTFADVQQFAANVPSYFDGTRNFGTDLGLAYTAATTPFIPTDPEPYVYTSVDPAPSTIGISVLGLDPYDVPLPGKDDLIDLLTNGIPYSVGSCPFCVSGNIDVLSLLVGQDEAAQISPYLEFSGSPLSGILWGSFGTTVSPLLQLHDDFASIATAFSGSTHDFANAIHDLIDMPANVTNAFLNGYGDISLGTFLTDFGISDPSGVDVSAIQLDLGGLLSPGGSLIDGIGIDASLGNCSIACATFDVPSSAVGPIASLFEQDQAVAEAIGWDGVGQPLAHLFTELTTLVN
jgi:hypothetical protein